MLCWLCGLLSSPLTVLVVVVPTLYLFIAYKSAKNKREFEARHGVPYCPQPGLLRSIITKIDVEKIKLETTQKVGNVFGFSILFQDTILVAVPELVQIVMSKEFTNFTNRRKVDISDPIFKHAVSVTSDETWKRQRAIITPTFSTGKLRNMMPRMRITLNTLIANIEEVLARENKFDLKKMANSFTMDTIVQTAFGLELDSLKDPNNEIVKLGQKLFSKDFTFKQFFQFLIIFGFPRLARSLNLVFNAEVNDYFGGLVKNILQGKRELIRTRANFRPSNFIELLLEAEAEYEKQDGKAGGEAGDKKAVKYMSNDEIISQCVLFFLAGFETSASTIAMTLHELAMNQDAQHKLYQEIQDVGSQLNPDGAGDLVELVEFDHLAKLPYLSAVVNETLRLHAPATFTERRAAKDMTLATSDGRYSVKLYKDDIVHVPFYTLHMDPHNFPQPEAFKPERFINQIHHNYAYLPFGQGPRNCVAKSFALMEVKLAVLHLIHRYKFTRCAQTIHPPELYIQNNIHTPKAIVLQVDRR